MLVKKNTNMLLKITLLYANQQDFEKKAFKIGELNEGYEMCKIFD